MNKFIEHINKYSVEEIVNQIVTKGRDIEKAIQSTRDCRTEFQKKTQELQWALEKHLDKYIVGMTLEAKEDCMNNFRKGERFSIDAICENGDIVIGGGQIEEQWIRKYFKIVESR